MLLSASLHVVSMTLSWTWCFNFYTTAYARKNQ